MSGARKDLCKKTLWKAKITHYLHLCQERLDTFFINESFLCISYNIFCTSLHDLNVECIFIEQNYFDLRFAFFVKTYKALVIEVQIVTVTKLKIKHPKTNKSWFKMKWMLDYMILWIFGSKLSELYRHLIFSLGT